MSATAVKRILIVMLLLAFPVSTAKAAPVDTPVNLRGHDVTAQKVFKIGEDPGDPGNCVVALFAEFPDRKNETATHWYTNSYADRPGSPPRPTDGAIDPPYDDVFTFGGLTWRAPKGKHWALIGKSWADGVGGSAHCARAYGKYPQIYPDPIKVRYEYTTSGYITGYVNPVTAWGEGNPYSAATDEEFPPAEMTKLLTGLRIKAKGKEGTFTAPVKPDGAVTGYYIIKVPKKALGPFKVAPVSPDGIALEPKSVATTLTPGRVFRVDYETGYDCSAKPPGMKFVPSKSARFFRRDGVGAEYDCRSRRLAMSFAADRATSYDAQSKGLSCRWPDGSQAPYNLRQRYDSLPMPLQSGGVFSGVGSDPFFTWANGTFGDLQWKARFVRPNRLKVEVQNAACSIAMRTEILETRYVNPD